MSRAHEGHLTVVERIRALSESQPRMEPNVSWLTCRLEDPWVNAGDPYGPLQFRMTEDGSVEMDGAVGEGLGLGACGRRGAERLVHERSLD